MEDLKTATSQEKSPEAIPDEKQAAQTEGETNHKKSQGSKIAILAVIALFVIVLAGSIFLAFQDVRAVAAVRDVFVILMALVLAIIGTALVILIIQISNLINILKNDIKPLLDSGTETVNTLRGTVRFMSDNLTEPVIKLNESLASLKRIGQLFNLFRK